MKTKIASCLRALSVLCLVVVLGASLGGCGKDPVSPRLNAGGASGSGGSGGGGGGGGGGGVPPTPAPVYQNDTFTPGKLTELFPAWRHGDRDFGGHGPYVQVQAECILVPSSPTKVVLQFKFKANETRSDSTWADLSYEKTVYTAPSGWVVDAITSASGGYFSYVDTNHGYDDFSLNSAGIIAGASIVGDTDGNDVGNATEDDCHAHSITFYPVTVRLRKL